MSFLRSHCKCLCVLLLVASAPIPVEAGPGRAYWAQIFDDQVCQIEASGTGRRVLLQFPQTNGVVDLAVDPSTGQIFWAQAFEDRIQRATLEGSNTATIVEFPISSGIVALALDHLARKVYWAQTFGDRIMRADFSGANVETVLQFPEVFDIVDLELDPVQRTLYWVESQDDTIRRSNLDGSGIEDIVAFPSASGVVGLAVSPDGEFLYWAQTFSDRIKRINLSDAIVETIVENPVSNQITDIAIDPNSGNLYWTQSADDTLHRTDLGGSSPVVIADWPDVNGPIAIITDPIGSFFDCTTDTDCDDLNECTSGTCLLSTSLCEFSPLAAGTACGDQTPASECDQPDACDDAGVCDPNPIATGTPCDDQNICTENDACDQGVCSGDAIPDCGGCVLDSDCDDGAACTLDECISDECVYQDLCADNGIFCDGAESCDVQAGVCMSAGDPCPGSCSEIGGCPCGTPAAESVGPRYIGVMPLPADSSTPMKLLVESAELPCLSKFVGSLACGGKGDVCSSDADCNACTGTNAPCLTDFDCRTCSDQPTIPCTTDSDCNVDATCMTIQMCQVSELLCLSTGAPTPIDIDDDGVFDGTLAVLVDDPADALSLTPSEWVGGFTAHCNLSMGSCVSDADCDAGKCALPDGRASSTSCSVASQDCAGGETCLLVEICLKPAVYLHGVDIIPSESDTTGTDPVFVPQTYDVSAQCGGAPTAATTLEMRLWGDVAENNKLVNVTDISFILLGFQGRWDAARGLTKVGVDLVTTGGPCFTDPESINATDLLRALRAFQRKTYASEVISSTAATGCLLPCP